VICSLSTHPTSRCDHEPTQALHDLGQSLWLDNITREILDNGTLRRYVDELSVTGLTSNPTIFDEAIGNGSAYDAGIQKKTRAGLSGETLFLELALEDLRRAADVFRPIHDRSGGADGWVSMEVSPLLASDTRATIDAALQIHKLADRPNLYVKIPGTAEGVPAIEAAIFAGVPVNVTLLFSARAISCGGRRLYARSGTAHRGGLGSAHQFRGVGVREPLGPAPSPTGAAAAAQSAGCGHRHANLPRALRTSGDEALARSRGRRRAQQRMLWASTGVKDPKAPADLYVTALRRPRPSIPCLKRLCWLSRNTGL